MQRISFPALRNIRDAVATSPLNSKCRVVLPATAMVCLFLAAPARADYVISGGSATLSITEGLTPAIDTIDAYFNATTSRADCLALPAPGNVPFTSSGNTVTLVDQIRPSGATLPSVPGRTPQATTLVIADPSNVLESWTTSNNSGAFVGNTSLGAQIAFTDMQRWTSSSFTGSLLYGDFGLRYTGTNLVLTSNIDFNNASYAVLGSPTISVVGNNLTISARLLMGGALALLDPSAVPGTPFGTITVNATLSPVPEPTSIVLMAIGGFGAFAILCGRKRRQSGI